MSKLRHRHRPVANSYSDEVVSDAPAWEAGRSDYVRAARLNLVSTWIYHPTREELIREAAYHRAEARGFAAGHELEDWLAAEAEVSQRMGGEGRAY